MNEKKRRPVLIEGDDLFGDVALLVDVTSIRTEKPVGSFENQKLLWDGHHKVYGVKIQVAVAASHPFEALFISEVVEGHIHDFSLFKRDLHPLIEYLQVTNEDRHKNSLNESNAQWKIMADRGYQGVVEGLELIIPIKNTKAKEEIEYNAQLAEKRIPVEWFFGRMKRLWKLLANRYRNGLDDAKIDIEIAVWLTNLNIQANDLTEDDGKFEQQCLIFNQDEVEKQTEKRHESNLMFREKMKRKRKSMHDEEIHMENSKQRKIACDESNKEIEGNEE